MRSILVLVIALLLADCAVFGQGDLQGNKGISLSLLEAIRQAEKNYPLLRSKLYEAESARKSIDLSRNSLVPSLDITYQADLATYNNITGMLYAPGIVPITGPVVSVNNYTPVFGSAASLLLSWQPTTFGRRNAEINVSKVMASGKTADAANEIFKHKINVINAYLDLLLATELVKVYEANIRRTEFNLKQAGVLAITGLRPGADTALFNSELSGARIDLLNARKNWQTRQISLSELLVSDSGLIATDTLFFQKLPAGSALEDSLPAMHPLLQFSRSQLDFSKSREDQLKKAWLPTLTFWGTTYARGSGVYPDGSVKSADGFGFRKYNYGLGLQVSLPILKFSELHIQQEQQALITRSYEQRVQQTVLQLSKQQAISEAGLQNALLIAGETPIRLQSARHAFNALQVRYHAGLVNFADIIQTQYSLVKAEADWKTSYWEAWKALLYKTAVTGDLNIFLNQVK